MHTQCTPLVLGKIPCARNSAGAAVARGRGGGGGVFILSVSQIGHAIEITLLAELMFQNPIVQSMG
jgi:hypothetical protein